MAKRVQTIHGDYISEENAIAYCDYCEHEGYMDRKLCKERHCLAKKCKHLIKINEKAFERQKYRNVPKCKKRG